MICRSRIKKIVASVEMATVISFLGSNLSNNLSARYPARTADTALVRDSNNIWENILASV